MLLKKYFIFLVFALSFTSCNIFRPLSLVPTFSAAIIQDKTDLGKQVDLMYTLMEQSSDKDYDTYVPDYNAADNLINSIIIRDQVRNKSALIVRQDILYRDLLAKFQAEHKAKVQLNNSEIRVYKQYARDMLKSLLVAEKSLK